MHRFNAPMESFTVTSKDGTVIRAFKCGNGPHRWLLPPGLGTPVLSWKYLFEFFQNKMTIVTWDPRGCYGSEKPEDLSRLRLEDHVDDAEAIAKHLGWLDDGKFVTGGWSMGIEIGLEFYSRFSSSIEGMTLINGAHEHVLETAFAMIPNARAMLRGALHGMSAAGPVFAPVSRYLLGQDWAIEFLKSLGLVAANADFFGQVVQDFRDLDFGTYFKMILMLDDHSAEQILDTVAVPTLVTAGTGDKMTPLSVSEHQHVKIKDSELFVVPTGTHYTTLEFPELINLRLDHFFRTRIWPKSWDCTEKKTA